MTDRQRLSAKSVKVLELIAEGRSYSQIVDGNSGLTYHDIFLAAEDALSLCMKESDYQERIAKIKGEYPKAYEKWTDEEDQRLVALHRDGQTIEDLCGYFQRQPGGIRSRLNKLLPGGIST